MNIETARGIATRIWGDSDYCHVPMDSKLAEEIAHKLLECAQQAVEGRTADVCSHVFAWQDVCIRCGKERPPSV